MNSATDELRERAEELVEHVQESVAKRPGERAALRRSLGHHPDESAIRPAARRVLTRHVREEDSEAVERAFYAVAALIAAQPRSARGDEVESIDTAEDQTPTGQDQPQNSVQESRQAPAANALLDLGSALGRSAWQRSTTGGKDNAGQDDQEAPEGTSGREQEEGSHRLSPQEKRLHLLCRQNLEGLHRHLPRVIRFLRAERVSIDWPRLVCDMARWDQPGANGRNRVAKQWLDGYYRTIFSAQRRQRNERPEKDEDRPTDK